MHEKNMGKWIIRYFCFPCSFSNITDIDRTGKESKRVMFHSFILVYQVPLSPSSVFTQDFLFFLSLSLLNIGINVFLWFGNLMVLRYLSLNNSFVQHRQRVVKTIYKI